MIATYQPPPTDGWWLHVKCINWKSNPGLSHHCPLGTRGPAPRGRPAYSTPRPRCHFAERRGRGGSPGGVAIIAERFVESRRSLTNDEAETHRQGAGQAEEGGGGRVPTGRPEVVRVTLGRAGGRGFPGRRGFRGRDRAAGTPASADLPPSCAPLAIGPKREWGVWWPQTSPPSTRPPPPSWPGSPPCRGGRQRSAPWAAGAAPGSPLGARPRVSRGSRPAWPPSAAAMALKMVKGSIDRMFDKNLQDLVRGIRNHKEDEAKYISQCIDEIKQELKQDNIAVKGNAVCKPTYLQMLGYDISWAAFIIEVMSASKFTFKRIGYLAASQCFHEGTDVIMLTTNQIRKDLSSPSQYDTGVALTDLSCATPADCVPAGPLSLRCPGSRSERPSACNTG
ncbi:uncharacterized protein PS065_002840 [Dugong dugon]